MSPLQVRDAGNGDLRAIVEIYNASILTTSTWSERFQILPERQYWFDARRRAGDVVLVAEQDGEVIGFAAYGEFRDNAMWPGYRFTVEHTVHVREGFEGKGVGRTLMTELLDRARAAGLHTMIAAVDSENTGSIAFHERLGFTEVGRLPEIGLKHDRWLDLVLLQRHL